MSKISYLKVENFRKLKNFECRFKSDSNMVCIIGRGDSGKTTLLEAISLVLSPTWNLSFNDTDFTDLDVTHPIRIEVIVYDLPDNLYSLNGTGYCSIFLNKYTLIEEELSDSSLEAVRIVLTVTSDLEPKWIMTNLINDFPIKASDRSKLNVFFISDSIDRYFSWNKGTPLAALLKKELNPATGLKEQNGVLDIFREAKESIDNRKFAKFETVEKKFKDSAIKLGYTIHEINTSIDWKDLYYNEGRLCLHEGKIPFRLKGKGSKRLLSIALQLSLIENSGIILIDEVEQGLEPDRVQQIVSILKRESETGAQVFISTHSSNAVVELDVKDLFRMKNKTLYNFSDENKQQGFARTNPEAFFAKRIIVAEGATEIGLLRAINDFLQKQRTNFSSKDIRIADGKGTSMIDYCNILIEAGYEVCLLCDNDRPCDIKSKERLISKGVKIIQTEENFCLEKQLFSDLSWDAVKKLFEFGKNMKGEKALSPLRHGNYLDFDDNLKEDSIQIRKVLGILSSGKEISPSSEKNESEIPKKRESNNWFKSISNGEDIGSIILEDIDNFKGTHLDSMFKQLQEWIHNE